MSKKLKLKANQNAGMGILTRKNVRQIAQIFERESRKQIPFPEDEPMIVRGNDSCPCFASDADRVCESLRGHIDLPPGFIVKVTAGNRAKEPCILIHVRRENVIKELKYGFHWAMPMMAHDIREAIHSLKSLNP